jgi:CheY-like chemotaxis protein
MPQDDRFSHALQAALFDCPNGAFGFITRDRMKDPLRQAGRESGSEKEVKDPAPAAAAPAPAVKKILVVEDERITQTVISLMLKGVGYTVFTAKDAATALKIIRTEQPDLMTLDIDLSRDAAGEVWDGFRIVEWLHHHRPGHTIPFIIVSAGNPAVVKKRAESLGAFAYLSKPIDKQALVGFVQEAIGEAPPPPAAAKPPAPPNPSLPPIPPAK